MLCGIFARAHTEAARTILATRAFSLLKSFGASTSGGPAVGSNVSAVLLGPGLRFFSEHVFDVVNEQDFMLRVVQSKIPIVLYATAAWCQPCAKLKPVLDRMMDLYQGKVKVAQVDVDKNRKLAQQLNIEAVPMFFGIVNGQMIDVIKGVPTETQLTTFVKNVASAKVSDLSPDMLKSIEGMLVVADQSYKKGDIPAASKIYASVLAKENWKDFHPLAMSGLAACALSEGSTETAKDLVEKIRQSYPDRVNTPFIAKTIATVELAFLYPTAKGETLESVMTDSMKKPDDIAMQLKLAATLFRSGRMEEGINGVFLVIRRNRTTLSKDKSPLDLLRKMMDVVGVESVLAKGTQRRLANLLFA